MVHAIETNKLSGLHTELLQDDIHTVQFMIVSLCRRVC